MKYILFKGYKKMNLQDFEFYKYRATNSKNYGFIYRKGTDSQLEGDIKLSLDKTKGRMDFFIDYIELCEETSYGDKSDMFMEELELYLEENIEEILSRVEDI